MLLTLEKYNFSHATLNWQNIQKKRVSHGLARFWKQGIFTLKYLLVFCSVVSSVNYTYFWKWAKPWETSKTGGVWQTRECSHEIQKNYGTLDMTLYCPGKIKINFLNNFKKTVENEIVWKNRFFGNGLSHEKMG